MSAAPDGFPRRTTPYFESLAGDTPSDPIRMQFEPAAAEERILEYEADDPLNETRYTPVPRLIHRYRNRALLLTTASCAVHCRYCFRRHFAGSGVNHLSAAELSAAVSYLAEHREIEELLLSGGDPFTMTDSRIDALLAVVREARPDVVIRICTRVPGVLPGRITDELVDMLAAHGKIWTVAQFNHPAELTDESTAAIGKLIDHGIPVVSQTVLLRAINDDPEVLATLFQGLVSMRVKPYYLFQADLARGTSHFRVPLDRGLEIVGKLRGRVSSLAMPVYAVDIPGGGGKITLDDASVSINVDGWFELAAPDGRTGCYPSEGEDLGEF